MCDDALLRLEKAVRWLPVEIEVVDITTDADLESEFHLRIPVVLDRRKRPIAEGQISSLAALKAALSALL